MDQLRQGKGILNWKNENTYEGEYVYGNRTGYGLFTWNETDCKGDTHESYFVNGARHGRAKYTYFGRDTGLLYHYGNYKDSKIDGLGLDIYSNNSYLISQYLQGKKNGINFTYYRDQSLIEINEFKENERIGRKLCAKDKTEFTYCEHGDVGLEGLGIQLQANGMKFYGIFVNGIKQGFGCMIYPNNEIYIGDFVNDQRNGNGWLIQPDHTDIRGKWKNDTLIRSEVLIPNYTSI